MVLTQAEAFHHSQLGELSLSLSGSNSPALPRIASRIWLSWLIIGFWRSRHTHRVREPENTPGQPWMWGEERLYELVLALLTQEELAVENTDALGAVALTVSLVPTAVSLGLQCAPPSQPSAWCTVPMGTHTPHPHQMVRLPSPKLLYLPEWPAREKEISSPQLGPEGIYTFGKTVVVD